MKPTVLVLGSGPIRIGQGIEFDYSCVHCVWALKRLGYRAIIVNNNPETVSTDFDTGDGLYFEPVTLEDVLSIIEREQVVGVACQFGGQTAINLAQDLHAHGVRVLGTSAETIAMAEDREQFENLLESLELRRPRGAAVRSLNEAVQVATEIGYPVLLRPSFVLGGRAMEIMPDEARLREFFQEAEEANPGHPVLVDKYIFGQELEVDVICDGENTLVPGIMEHIERAGVHSGDSMAVYPPVTVPVELQREVVDTACKLAKALGIRGLMNIQFVASEGELYVIEVNPRASRTVPYLSKVTGVPMIDLATRCMMGLPLEYESGLWMRDRVLSLEQIDERMPSPGLFAVKSPVFSFQKLAKVEPSVGPEMKSTGEVLGIDRTYPAALYKSLIASGIRFKAGEFVVITLNQQDKSHALEIAKPFIENGFKIAATGGTLKALTEGGIEAYPVKKIQEGSPNLVDLILENRVSLMINTPAPGSQNTPEAARIRRSCIESGIACITNIDTAMALAQALEYYADPSQTACLPYTEYLSQSSCPV